VTGVLPSPVEEPAPDIYSMRNCLLRFPSLLPPPGDRSVSLYPVVLVGDCLRGDIQLFQTTFVVLTVGVTF